VTIVQYGTGERGAGVQARMTADCVAFKRKDTKSLSNWIEASTWLALPGAYRIWRQ